MDVLRRDSAPFSGRVWQQIDAIVAGVKQASCTARRVLEVDGPYGLGLTSLSRDDILLQPRFPGASPRDWGVRRAVLDPQAVPGADPDEIMQGRGTYLVQGSASPVPMIASEFLLSLRSIEAFDDECQPLDLSRAVRAARDIALEEERLIYYGNPDGNPFGLLSLNIQQQYLQQVLLTIAEGDPRAAPNPIPPQTPAIQTAVRSALGEPFVQQIFQQTPQPIAQRDFLVALALIRQQIGMAAFVQIQGSLRLGISSVAGPLTAPQRLQRVIFALQALAERGFPGPYALVVSPNAYSLLLDLVAGTDTFVVGLLERLFEAGVYVAPVIQPTSGAPRGVIVTTGRAFARLVVGQDWSTAYRGTAGVYHRFVIMTSLRLEITEPRALQLLI